MLAVFPIQFLAPFAYFILRIVVGFFFIRFGVTRFKSTQHTGHIPLVVMSTILYIAEIAIGAFLIIGAYTQVWALLGSFLCIFYLCKPSIFGSGFPRSFFAILLTTSLSITITGAGIFAFDLPI